MYSESTKKFIAPNSSELVKRLGVAIVDLAKKSIADHGQFSIALSVALPLNAFTSIW